MTFCAVLVCVCPLQLGKSLEAELKMSKISNVGIHNLSPGMVTTELLMSGANTPTSKFFINCLGGCAGLQAAAKLCWRDLSGGAAPEADPAATNTCVCLTPAPLVYCS